MDLNTKINGGIQQEGQLNTSCLLNRGVLLNNFDEFWRAYPGKKVARPKCKEKYDKLTEDEHKEVMLGIQAQLRYRVEAKKAGEFMPEWCNTQTFINQQRWYDEIGSHAELKEKRVEKECCIQGCSEPVHAPTDKRQYCYHHYSHDSSGKLRSDLILVDSLRNHYAEHTEIHNFRGKAALKFMRYSISKMKIVGDR